MTIIRKHTLLLAPLTLLLMAATTVPASNPRPDRGSQIAAAARLVDGNQPAEALAILDPLLANSDLPIERGEVELLRSFALARLNRLPEARKAVEASYAASPSPTPLLLRQLFLLRAFTGDPDGAVQIVQLMAAGDPKWLEQLPGELVFETLGAISDDEARSFDVSFSLVTADYHPVGLPVAVMDSLRLKVVRGLQSRGRLDEAPPVVAQLINTTSLVQLAIDRRFQPLWPALEKRLGPGADIADEAYVKAARAAFESRPGSLADRLGLAEALNIASREEEALAVTDIAPTAEDLAKFGNRDLWLVNLQAMMLADTGKVDAGLARFALLNTLPIEGRPSLVATLINQAILAESVDRPDAALAAIAQAEAKATDINDYGRRYLDAVRVCALTQLGRKAEAAAAAAPVIAKPDANADAYRGTMICLGRMDAAAAAVIGQLKNEKTRSDMLFALQPFLITDRATARDRRERAAMRVLKARPDVKAAFLALGRDLPAAVSPPR